jgi:hypothetical protein
LFQSWYLIHILNESLAFSRQNDVR